MPALNPQTDAATGRILGASVRISWPGAEEVALRLDAMTRRDAGRAARGALALGAQPMAAAVKSRIHSVSGLLASTVRVRMGRGDRPGRYSVWIGATASRARFARARAKAGRPGQALDVLSKGGRRDRYSVYYAAMVEYGHRGPKGGRVPAHPFARPGFDATVDQAMETAERELMDRTQNPF